MTKNKSFKGRVRARMDKTHESYATARRQLLAKTQSPEDPAKRPYSDAVIQANTGKTWDEWFAVLDRVGRGRAAASGDRPVGP